MHDLNGQEGVMGWLEDISGKFIRATPIGWAANAAGYGDQLEEGTSNFVGELTGTAADERALAARQASIAKSEGIQRDSLNRQIGEQRPWQQAGLDALSGLQNPEFQRDFSAGDFQADPGYQFRLGEGQKAVERSAAARGGLLSGANLKGVERFSQGLASQEYQNAYGRFNADKTRRFNRLSSLAGRGQAASDKISGLRVGNANQLSRLEEGRGNAQAANEISQYGRYRDIASLAAGAYSGGAGGATASQGLPAPSSRPRAI